MNIGKEQRELQVEPVEWPKPVEQPAPEPIVAEPEPVTVEET